MDERLSPGMEEAGVRGYGYKGPRSGRADYGTQDFPVIRDSKPSRRGLLYYLKVLAGLFLVIPKGDAALTEYYDEHKWLAAAVIGILTGIAVLAIVVIILYDR